MPELTGAQIIVETMLANDIDVVYGIPGGHTAPLYHAFAGAPALRHVLGRHEQGLGFMAEGYARASGKIAAAAVTSGPGVANITHCLGQATTDSAPILVIASTPSSDLVGKNRGGLHDLNNSLELARPVSRYAEHCETLEEIHPKLSCIIRNLREQRPGGGFIQVPTDVMGATADVEIAPNPATVRRAPAPADVQAVCIRLAAAERPLIIAGYGAVQSGAGAVIATLAERLGAVVSATTLARGVVDCDRPYVIYPDGCTPTAVNDVFADADVVLAVGTMFRQEDTAGWSLDLHDKLIHIDIDANELGRSYRPELAIQADARLACEAIAASLERAQPADSSWAEAALARQQVRLDERRSGPKSSDMVFAEAFRQVLPRDAMLFADRCNIGYWAYRVMPFHEPRAFHYPMGYGGLGAVLPQAIGARMACPDRKSVCVLGDGGMQYTLTELAVAVQEQISFPIVVSNNECYGAIKANFSKAHPGLTLGTELSGPDLKHIAAAYGIPFARVTERQQFLDLFADEMKRDRLVLIEFVNDIADP